MKNECEHVSCLDALSLFLYAFVSLSPRPSKSIKIKSLPPSLPPSLPSSPVSHLASEKHVSPPSARPIQRVSPMNF